MKVQRFSWFRFLVFACASGTVWWLSTLVGIWPNGPQSISAALVFLLCLLGAERLYSALLGIAAYFLWSGRDRSTQAH
jgi:hypothetical protein